MLFFPNELAELVGDKRKTEKNLPNANDHIFSFLKKIMRKSCNFHLKKELQR